jgi:hypothetical protein
MSIRDRLGRRATYAGLVRPLRRGYLIARRPLARAGFDLVYASYDSPIPDLTSLDPGFFDRRSPMRGIAFDIDRQLEFVERELAEYCREFDPPLSAAEAGPRRFYLRNGTYESVDAELLYAMVRRFRPRRVIELGSGYSTLIIREALERAGGGASSAVLHTYDPYPSQLIEDEWPVRPIPVQAVPDDAFRELDAGDLLFVDTSHTVKAGGDVNRIVLDLLPILRAGVIVHFHDIFLPYPYSRAHLDGAHFWNEQWLLQAFLTGNESWEVLIGAQVVARAHPERLSASIPSFSPGTSPGAFWIRRRT